MKSAFRIGSAALFATIAASSVLAQPACWTVETIPDSSGDVGQFSSLGFRNGEPWISYYDATHGDLKVATKSSAGWNIQSVVTAGDVGRYSSLKVRSDGTIFVGYYNATNQRPEMVYRNSSGWHGPEIVPNPGSAGLYLRLALTPDGRPAVVYTDSANFDFLSGRTLGRVWYSERSNSGLWATQVPVTSEATCFDLSFSIPQVGNPAISFASGYDPTGVLRYAESVAGVWTSALTIDNTFGTSGRFNALVHDSSGVPSIAYLRDQHTRQMIATRTGPTWPDQASIAELFPKNFFGTYTSMAVLDGDHLGIATCSNPGIPSGLYFIEQTDSGWQSPTLIDGTTGTGAFTSVAASSSDVAFSYYNASTQRVFFALRSSYSVNITDCAIAADPYRNPDGEWTVALYLKGSGMPSGRATVYIDGAAGPTFSFQAPTELNSSTWSFVRPISFSLRGMSSRVEVRIDTPDTMTSGEIIFNLTRFAPDSQGFRFDNWSSSLLNMVGMCSGMVVTARELFLCTLEIPPDSEPPLLRTPLGRSIWLNHVGYNAVNIQRFLLLRTSEPNGLWTDCWMRSNEDVSRNRPVPISLLVPAGVNHTVLACGTISFQKCVDRSDLGASATPVDQIWIYDPNESLESGNYLTARHTALATIIEPYSVNSTHFVRFVVGRIQPIVVLP